VGFLGQAVSMIRILSRPIRMPVPVSLSPLSLCSAAVRWACAASSCCSAAFRWRSVTLVRSLCRSPIYARDPPIFADPRTRHERPTGRPLRGARRSIRNEVVLSRADPGLLLTIPKAHPPRQYAVTWPHIVTPAAQSTDRPSVWVFRSSKCRA